MKRHVYQHARRARKLHQFASPRKVRRRLGIQPLEGRSLLAADVGFTDGFVTINGTEAADAAEMYVADGQFIVNVSERSADGSVISSNQRAFAEECVEGVFFNGHGGDDVLVNDSNVPVIGMGGAGNDLLTGGGGSDLLAGGSGDDILIGSETDLLMGGAGDNLSLDDSIVAPATPIDPPADEAPAEDALPGEDDAVGDDATAGEDDPAEIDETCDTAPPTEDEPPAESDQIGEDVICALPAAIEVADDLVETADEISTEETPPAEDELPAEIDPADEAPPIDEVTDVADEAVEVTQAVADCVDGDTPVDLTEPPAAVPEEAAPPADADDDVEETADEPVICTDLPDGEATPAETTDEEPVDDSAPVAEEEPAVEAAPETDDDMVVGGLGDDFIYGAGGDDMLFGGDMDAELLGELALNWLTAHSGANA